MSLAMSATPVDGVMTYQRRPTRPDPAVLARGHMPLVRKIAWHVHGRVSSAIDVEDLVQIGMVALVEAANGYEDRGHAFSTYASVRIRGAMIDHLRRHATLCRSAMAKRKAINEAIAKLESELGRHPSEPEIARAMGMAPAEYREMADSAVAARQESIDELPEREAMVLQLYFVEELNLEEIGEVLGVGAARVCQIKKAALDRLRKNLKSWAD